MTSEEFTSASAIPDSTSLCASVNGRFRLGAIMRFVCASSLAGRYVTIVSGPDTDALSLCEVAVMGSLQPVVTVPPPTTSPPLIKGMLHG